MSDPIIQLTADDFEDAMDFINLVFSVHGPIHFQTLLPKLYKSTDEHMGWNYAIKRHGKIRALIGLYPMEFNIGGVALEGAGIGAVAVHPNDRGQGHMKRLMQHHLDKMKADGCHFSWLAGQRQRYNYFGYEVCGRLQTFLVSKSNIRHAYKDVRDIQFDVVNSPDDPRLQKIKQWHENSPIHITRPLDSLFDIFTSWRHKLYAAMFENELVGYIGADTDESVVLEMGGISDEWLTAMLPAWVNSQPHSAVTFETSSLPSALTFELSRISESQSIRSNGNWQIFDWSKVVDAALKLKNRTMLLPDGKFILNIKNYGTIELLVDGPEASCRKTTKTPDLSIESLAAHRLLFGPLSPVQSGLSKNPLLNSWCPLPLFLPRQDEV